MGYDDARPVHYKLGFEPDIKGSVFAGTAEITIQCARPVRVIEMDCAELAVSSCMVRQIPGGSAARVAAAGGDNNTVTHNRGRGKDASAPAPAAPQDQAVAIPAKNITIDPKRERLVIRMPRGTSLAGRAVISMSFEGALNDRLLGFYQSSYKAGGSAGVRRIATTQFEAADARRAFPCWDRPDAKATFEISITTYEPGHTAISNMPVSRIQRHGRGSPVRTFHFATTPPMSTYLVYLGAGEFAYVSEAAGSSKMDNTEAAHARRGQKAKDVRTEIRVVTTPSVERRHARFAISYARTLLDLYEEYFGIRYPLPKLDLIAIPDFAAGAMENWGAITFRENLLLYDSKRSSTRTKQLIAEVISHELAHQWFGNLVTMKWWNDLWLNESFATFMATKMLDKIHPEWDLWKQFLTDAMRTGMDLDSLKSTHPVDVPVRSPGQIREIFDAISYDKGGCILRMLEHYVGEAAFRRGLTAYLKKFMYDNASGADLWESIERASKKPVSEMMQSWLGTAGFPAVHLSTGPDGDTLLARQERHMHMRPARRTAGRPDPVWPVPLSLRPAGARRTTSVLMSEESVTIPIARVSQAGRGASAAPTPAVIANPSRTGFYRVIYEDNMLSSMQDLAGAGKLDPHDLWGLQDDLFAMCVSGRASVSRYMDLLGAYTHAKDPVVLSDAASNLRRLTLLASRSDEAALGKILACSVQFHSRIYDGITGWSPKPGESHTVSLLRGPVVALLGRMEHPDVAPRCASTYEELCAHANSKKSTHWIHPDLIEPACTVAAWASGRGRAADATHRSLAGLHNAAATTEQSVRFLGAMCGFQRPDLLARTLRFALSDSVRSQNFFLPVVRVAENPHGHSVLWPWIRDNWGRISKKVGHGNPLLGRVIASLAGTCDASEIPALRRFFADNPVPGTEKTILQTVERIKIASRMRKQMRAEFGRAHQGA